MTPRTAKRPQSWVLSRTGRTMHTSPAMVSAAAMSSVGGNSPTPIVSGTACGIAPSASWTPVTRSLPVPEGEDPGADVRAAEPSQRPDLGGVRAHHAFRDSVQLQGGVLQAMGPVRIAAHLELGEQGGQTLGAG